jgi:serine phosphatase RsbU (regulator of sigma subunit)
MSLFKNILLIKHSSYKCNNLNENLFADYFVLYLPKDIVSGDFYWANINLQHPDYPHYFAVCDCTGHGVPGAFMSLLNIKGIITKNGPKIKFINVFSVANLIIFI